MYNHSQNQFSVLTVDFCLNSILNFVCLIYCLTVVPGHTTEGNGVTGHAHTYKRLSYSVSSGHVDGFMPDIHFALEWVGPVQLGPATCWQTEEFVCTCPQ